MEEVGCVANEFTDLLGTFLVEVNLLDGPWGDDLEKDLVDLREEAPVFAVVEEGEDDREPSEGEDIGLVEKIPMVEELGVVVADELGELRLAQLVEDLPAEPKFLQTLGGVYHLLYLFLVLLLLAFLEGADLHGEEAGQL